MWTRQEWIAVTSEAKMETEFPYSLDSSLLYLDSIDFDVEISIRCV